MKKHSVIRQWIRSTSSELSLHIELLVQHGMNACLGKQQSFHVVQQQAKVIHMRIYCWTRKLIESFHWQSETAKLEQK